MSSAPRIVIVDPTHDIEHILRGALALLSRQHILIEVPTADDALQEVLESTIDLVVTAYDVPGEMHGIELANRIVHESLGTPVIVLAEENDPRPDDEAVQGQPFQFFVRPVAEPFLRGLRFALDGESAVVAERLEAAPETDLGPVPTVDIDALRDVIISLMRDVGAMGIILADRTGRVLVDEGATGYIDREKLAVVLGPSFARSTEVSPLVGGDAWTMHYYDGERLNVFGLSLGMHYFMCLIFEGANRGAFGAVTMFGRRAADQMIEMMGDAAYATRQVQPSAARVKAAEVEEIKAPAPAKKVIIEQEAPIQVQIEPPILEPVAEFDPDTLFGQAIDESAAENMFSPEQLGDFASMLIDEESERVGYDEAINMGIIDD
ncbi:MAG: response regulator [Anaerolineae bacterium]|jgi:hypothetical protein|nr:response regulator [Anaerolineae bacterium]